MPLEQNMLKGPLAYYYFSTCFQTFFQYNQYVINFKDKVNGKNKQN